MALRHIEPAGRIQGGPVQIGVAARSRARLRRPDSPAPARGTRHRWALCHTTVNRLPRFSAVIPGGTPPWTRPSSSVDRSCTLSASRRGHDAPARPRRRPRRRPRSAPGRRSTRRPARSRWRRTDPRPRWRPARRRTPPATVIPSTSGSPPRDMFTNSAPPSAVPSGAPSTPYFRSSRIASPRTMRARRAAPVGLALLGLELEETRVAAVVERAGSTAALTAQPGSRSCWQSRNRQPAASAAMSSKASATSVSQSCSSRMPGVSMISPPRARATSWRCTLVWRPRASHSRTSPVGSRSSPMRRLTIDDLPAPDGPRRATVRPGARYASRSASGASARVLIDVDRHARQRPTPPRRGTAAASSTRSDLFSTTHGARAAAARQHQIALDGVRLHVDVQAEHDEDDVDVRGDDLFLRLAAGGLAREPRGARQHLADLAARARRGPSRTATQSPTTGSACRPSARCFIRPADSARISPSAVRTRNTWLCSRTTRPGTRPAAACAANAPSRAASSRNRPASDGDSQGLPPLNIPWSPPTRARAGPS